jgi:hypothetical protein
LAKYVVTGNKVTINGTDLSSSVARAEIAMNVADVDVTDFGSAGYTELIGGLKSGTVSIDFHQDYASGSVEATIFPLLGSIATAVIIAGNGTAASSATPAYTATVLVNNWNPVSGAVGDLSTVSVTWPTSGVITKATA